MTEIIMIAIVAEMKNLSVSKRNYSYQIKLNDIMSHDVIVTYEIKWYQKTQYDMV